MKREAKRLKERKKPVAHSELTSTTQKQQTHAHAFIERTIVPPAMPRARAHDSTPTCNFQKGLEQFISVQTCEKHTPSLALAADSRAQLPRAPVCSRAKSQERANEQIK